MTNEEANFIMHAGKKGMKWGVRNTINRARVGIKNRDSAIIEGRKNSSRDRQGLYGLKELVGQSPNQKATRAAKANYKATPEYKKFQEFKNKKSNDRYNSNLYTSKEAVGLILAYAGGAAIGALSVKLSKG